LPTAVGAQGTYVPIPGSPDAVLNPAHRGAQGSTFTQNCTGLPSPVPPGGVWWHFLLPQNEVVSAGPTPDNIFTSLTAEFLVAGTVTITTFGPPAAQHAYISTPTDDILIDAEADGASLTPGTFPTAFNLSHTCASADPIPIPPPTTTAPPTTDPGSPTTTAPSLGQFPITKVISGSASGSQGPITIEIACSRPNGPIPDFVIPAGAQAGTVTTIVTGVTVPAVCVATEVSSGETDSVVVGRGATPAVRQVADVCAAPLSAVRSLPGIEFENQVDPAPTTSSPPTSVEPTTTTTRGVAPTATITPTTPPEAICGTSILAPSDSTVPVTGSLPVTGGSSSPGATFAGLAILAAGVALLVIATRRKADEIHQK
jgi:LPXTG-motif cell wall-anchored protein